MLRLIISFLLFISMLLAGLGSAPAAAVSGPRLQLESGINDLMTVLRNPELKGEDQTEKRRALISDTVFKQFDMVSMARLTMGRDWKELDAQQRTEFVGLFRALLEKSYVAVIDGYAGEKIEYLKEIIKGAKAEVQTRVIGEGREVPLHYRLRVEDGSWRVYDVIIENVSLVRNYRSQFGPILQKKGFAGLIAQMQEKLAADKTNE